MNFFSLFRHREPQDRDNAVLVRLRKAGSNLSKPHEMEFFLYFPTPSAAQEAASYISANGFAVDVRPGAEGESWLCLATKRLVPELTTLHEIRDDFEALVARLGGEYDGWGTPVER